MQQSEVQIVHPRLVNATAVAERLILPPSDDIGGFGALGLPSGLPLSLRPCASRLSRWQVLRAPAASSTMISLATMALLHFPRLCLAVGKSRPLRPPATEPLAQMLPCDAIATAQFVRLQQAVGYPRVAQLWAMNTSSEGGDGDAHANLMVPDVGAYESSQHTTHTAAHIPVPPTLIKFGNESDTTTLHMVLEAIAREQDPGSRALSASAGSDVHLPSLESTPSARGSAASVTTVGAFAGKHGAWRKANAEPSRLFAQCNSATLGGAVPDKPVQDCESWCRPERKPRHCLKCKCVACRGCAAKEDQLSSALPSRLPKAQKLTGLCLSVWRDDALDGAPLTFAPCEVGTWQRRQQQRWTVVADAPRGEGLDAVDTFRVAVASSGTVARLCVTAQPVYDGL